MAVITYHDIAQGSPEWHKLREGKYSGSNASKLLSSMNIDEYAKAVVSDFKGNYWTRRGHLLEDEAIKLYQVITGDEVKITGAVTNFDYPSAIYSPDGLVGNDLLLEIKCFGEKKHRELITGNIPISIMAQIHFGLLITNRKRAELIAYNPKRRDDGSTIFSPLHQFVILPIKKNKAIENNLSSIIKQLENNQKLPP